jgi:tripartite ATP-independent transporter DctP family solute receptor
MTMNRRAVLAALAAAPFISHAQAQGQAPIQLRISTAAVDSDWLSRALVMFKERLEAAAPGQFAVQVHPNGALFRQGTEVPALQRGNLEMSTMTTFEVEQQIPEYSIFSAGYLFRDYDHASKVFGGPIGTEYAARVAQAMQIQIIQPFYLGTRQLTLRQARNVRTPADLAGVKMRMPPGPGWLVLARALGTTPTPMAMPEVYLGLRTGAIDGQDNPLSITRANNLHEVTQQIVLTAHMVQPVFLSMAGPAWARLSDAQKAAVRDAAKAAAEFNDRSRLEDERTILEFFRTQGLQITTPDLDAFRAAVRRAYLESEVARPWPQGLWERIAAVQ